MSLDFSLDQLTKLFLIKEHFLFLFFLPPFCLYLYIYIYIFYFFDYDNDTFIETFTFSYSGPG